jgi:catechol 2,3-dioxygenase-like lactoylglutathione lyase family enzyme
MALMRLTRRGLLASLAVSAAHGQSPAFRALGIDHVALAAADPARSVAFYQRVFGTETFVSPTQKDRFFVRLGKLPYIAIAPPAKTKAGTVDHLCLAAAEPKAELRARLDAAGIVAAEGNADLSDLFATDPDGIRIQILQPGDLNPKTDMGRNLKAPGPDAGTPIFRPNAIDHLSVTVSNLDRAAAYYRQLLGREARRIDAARIAFPVGKGSLVVRGAAAGQAIGIDHFCVTVAAYDEAAVGASLRTLRSELKRWNQTDPPYFTDPDGIQVQVAAARP